MTLASAGSNPTACSFGVKMEDAVTRCKSQPRRVVAEM